MARTFGVVAVVAVAFCLLGVANCNEQLHVEGKVYCDTCRVAFETPVSYPLPGSQVRLSCRNRTTNVVTFQTEVITDPLGKYKIPVVGDHEDELCEITLLKSSDANCNEFLKDHIIDNDRVALTRKNGVAQSVRYANPLFFAKKEALPNCPDVLRQMGVLPPDFKF